MATETPPPVLVGEGRNGDFVHQTQKMGTEAGFKNVSQLWLDKGCLSYDQVGEKIEAAHQQIQDFRIPLNAITPTIDDSKKLVFRHEGTPFTPTTYALGQIAKIAGINSMTVEVLAGLRPDANGNDRNRTRDRETLINLIGDGFSLIDPNKTFLVRTQKDGTLRGWLSDSYQIINNLTLLEIVRNIIKDGVISHWREDGDLSTMWGNVLIPDTIRAEADSDYGAMYSIGNSEIGRRRFNATPSLFRAICMNGCIWDQKRGRGYERIHKGKSDKTIDVFALQRELREHLNAQIPLVKSVIDDFLGTKKIGWDGATAMPVFAALAGEFKLSKLTATDILQSWRTQCNVEDSFRGDKQLQKSAFSVINAVTRSSNDAKNPQEWVDRDELGGKLLDWKSDRWKHLFSKSRTMNEEEVRKAFNVSAH